MKRTLCVMMLVLLTSIAVKATVRYVKVDGNGAGDAAAATSWQKACADLQAVINQSAPGDTVWVAEGTYRPNRKSNRLVEGKHDRDNTFLLKKGVKIFGGFEGTETALDGRDWTGHETVLSGDLEANDGMDNSDIVKMDNAYHVVVVAGDAEGVRLDGFTVTGGYFGSQDEAGSVSVGNYRISREKGGGIHISGSSPVLANLTVAGNISENGGGIYNGARSPVLTHSRICDNRTVNGNGGGICNEENAAVQVMNTLISGNVAEREKNSGGDGGGIHSGEMAGYKLVNVTVTGNRAENKGGGICNLQSSSPLDLLNTIVWGNRSDRGNHNISNENKAVPSFENCLVEGCRNSGKWDAAFGKDNGNNTDADPVFADAGKEDFHLEEGSPAIDGGDSVLYMASYSGMFDPGISGLDGQTDLDGHRRRLAANVDIGACEGDGSDGDGDGGDDDGDGEDDGETPVIVPDDRGIVFVNQAKAGNGSSWEEACPNLHDPLLAAQTDPNIRQIWVALGTYTPRRPATGMSVIDSLNRENAFVLVKDVAVYGSFPADANSSEHTGIDDRHLTPHTVGGGSPLTVLSGDLKGDDLPGDLAAGRDDNAYHVVIAAGETGGALLDGFAVTGGNADGNTSVTVNGQEVDRHSGGGIYHDRGGRDTLRLLHLTVTENSAGNGGGIFTRQSCSMISHVSFHGNSAGNGGGMYNGTGAKPVLRHVAVKGNEAGSGGGIFSGEQAKPVLVHVTVNGNMAINGGGMYNAGTDAKPVLTNVTLGGNAAESGGGIYNADGAAPDLCNTIVWGNGNSENIYSDDQCRPLYEYCLIEGCGGSGNSNIDTDPLFAAPVACEGQPVTEGDYRLLEGSPAINRGNIEAFIRVYNEGHESDIADLEGQTDLDGNPCLTGAGLDMGAFEYASGDEPEDPEEPEEPEEVWIVTLPDIAGGAVPGIRSFSVVTPEEEYQILSDTKFQVPDQGNFAFTLAYEYGPVPTVVTANQVTVHPGNGVYTLSAITADQHVTVTASPEVTPPGHKREVVLPRVDGLTTDPPAGVHYVESGKDFVFKIIPVSMAPGFEPRVTTDRTTLPEDGEDVEMIRNEDGTYTVRILRVQEPVTVSIQLVASNEPPLNSTGRQVWSNGARLYLCSSQAGSAKIFTLVGQFVKTVDCVAGETGSVALPSGMYMVLLEGKTYKVVIH